MKAPALLLFILMASLLTAQGTAKSASFTAMSPYELSKATAALEAKCSVSDQQLKREGLQPDKIKQVREFCSKTTAEKYLILKEKFSAKMREPLMMEKASRITGRENSYSCQYGWSTATVPAYRDLGFIQKTCTGREGNPAGCRLEAGVACLWGCSNPDPMTGWIAQSYPTQKVMETYIFSKGYHKVYQPWTSGYGYDYARQLPYGYRYQLIWSSNMARTYGPEPDPEPNWYGFVNGFWPSLVQDWHVRC